MSRVYRAVVGMVVAVTTFVLGVAFIFPSATYGYDASRSTAAVVVDARPPESADLAERGECIAHTSEASAYDDRSKVARTSARPIGYRSAPNTAAGLADDVPAFARSQYGRVPAAERAAALERAPTCPYCGTSPSSQVDHIGALRRDWGAGGWADDFATRTGWVNDPGNLIAAFTSEHLAICQRPTPSTYPQ